MNYYIAVLKKYAVFAGRASRSEYWFFTLFNLIIAIVLGFVDGAAGLISAESGMGVLGSIYMLAVLLPGIAVTVRRLHDTGRSGWWLLLILIPLLGALALLVFFIFASQEEENKYGANPAQA
ncbi:MAG: DUF805 domain-containing protein [Gammaproteobacteria bacterium]|nr:DUF805 domain-containing protein [Gammaproteobacteria bacterium]